MKTVARVSSNNVSF